MYVIKKVASTKAEYLPPREDIIMQKEAAEDIYIIVSGEVEMIDYENEKEIVVGTLFAGDIFGEVAALCCTPQSFTFRTKTLTQLLRIKTTNLIQAIKIRQEDNILMLNNFLQVFFILLLNYKFVVTYPFVVCSSDFALIVISAVFNDKVGEIRNVWL